MFIIKKLNSKSKQKGVTLIIGLFLLIILSIVAITAMKSSIMQEKMTGGLTRKYYADDAAYSLLVSIENHLYKLYKNNNGTRSINCDYCGVDARDNVWHSFLNNKNMNNGSQYPGNTNLIASIAKNLQDTPRFVLYSANSSLVSNTGTANYSQTVGETDGGAAGSIGGNLGSENESSKLEFFRIATKANDAKGQLYVVYESVFAVRKN